MTIINSNNVSIQISVSQNKETKLVTSKIFISRKECTQQEFSYIESKMDILFSDFNKIDSQKVFVLRDNGIAYQNCKNISNVIAENFDIFNLEQTTDEILEVERIITILS